VAVAQPGEAQRREVDAVLAGIEVEDPVAEVFTVGAVAVVAGRDAEQVGARAAVQAVAPGAAIEDVVAALAKEPLVGVAADQYVVVVVVALER